MSTEDNKALVRRFFAAIDAHDFEGVDRLLATDYRLLMAGTPEPMDREGFKGFAAAFVGAMPDIRHAVEDQVAEGDQVATRLTISGTQQGALMGIPPTGKAVSAPALNIVRLADGQIVEHWINFDTLGMLQQLGAIPTPGQG